MSYQIEQEIRRITKDEMQNVQNSVYQVMDQLQILETRLSTLSPANPLLTLLAKK